MQLSKQENNGNKGSNVRKRVDKNQLAIRIIALVLCAVMLIGAAYYVIALLAQTSFAADAPSTVPTGTLSDESDIDISVGLMYGNGVTVSYKFTTVGGLTFGLQKLTGETKAFTSLWTVDSSSLIIADDASLKMTAGGDYVKSLSADDCTIGGYNIEVAYDFGSFELAKDFAETYTPGLSADYGCVAFPAYVNGEYRVRIGNFFSSDVATTKLNQIQYYLSAVDLQLAAPSNTGLIAIDPSTGDIAFEFDCGNDAVLGVKPTTETSYLKSPAGNIFSGVFAFKRYINTSDTNVIDGVSVINVLPLEDYVSGVLPYEVSNSWPLETLKAFAITVRSFTVSTLGRHNYSYGFDICSSTHCQVYYGVASVNSRVRQAVSETKGQVMTYGGKICTAYYSSSVGGITVGAHDAWGGNDSDYLKPIRTPWEDYYNHQHGFWIVEISPAELLVYLRDTKEYDELTGTEIVDIKVIGYAKNSTYIKTIEFVDDLGNTVRVTNTDKVRSVLGSYVKSSNFVVGKGSVDYFVDIVRDEPLENLSSSVSSSKILDDYIDDLLGNTYDDDSDEEEEKNYGQVGPDGKILIKMIDYSVRTESDIFVTSMNMFVDVMTSNGADRLTKGEANVICRNNAEHYGFEVPDLPDDPDNPPDIGITDGPTNPNDNIFSVIQHKTAAASDPDNFIIVGKGWGHGVGMSQYGAYDLAQYGYDYMDILTMYFSDIEIKNYKNVD